MRILKIELTGILQPKAEGLDLSSEAVQSQLYRELDALRLDLAERIRAKAAAYLPAHYTIFVRVNFERTGNKVTTTYWIDDPAVSGMSGLLARRAWKLSVPILSHVFRESVQERLQTLTVAVDDTKARIASYAPSRGWYSPLSIALGVAAVSAVYWLYVHGTLLAALRRSLS
ncbi:MAG: hypothetical protein ABL901_08190 [Hyphomicrobiaceae bacterium]